MRWYEGVRRAGHTYQVMTDSLPELGSAPRARPDEARDLAAGYEADVARSTAPILLGLPNDRRVARTATVWTCATDAPSYRHRIDPVVPGLRSAGWRVTVDGLPRGRYVFRILECRDQLARADCLLLGKVKLTVGERHLVRRSRAAVVFDVDDAIWLRKPRAVGQAPGNGWWRAFKFDRTCHASDLVLAGNSFVSRRAARRARHVESVPTSGDVEAFAAMPHQGSSSTVVWIGLPENLMCLEIVRGVLEELSSLHPDLKLRVVSSRTPGCEIPRVEAVPWSDDVEAEALSTAGIGIMPPTDDDCSRGKCGFKLLQYMAAGLTVVASSVGANRDLVVDGTPGCLVDPLADWYQALRRLLCDPDMARAMGAAGRRRAGAIFDRRRFATNVLRHVETIVPVRGLVLHVGAAR